MSADHDRLGLPDPAPAVSDAPTSDARFVRRALWVLVLLGLAWLLIELSALLLLSSAPFSSP